MKTIICSHGFGVKADARGMFPEIAMAFPNYKFIMFDYSQILPNGDVQVSSLDDQKTKLQATIDKQEGDVILLCHSQGSIIAGLVNLTKVTQVILIAPPTAMSMERVIEKMMIKPGSTINLGGISRLPRSDGHTTLLPKEYMESLKNRNPNELYQAIANKKPTAIIRATEDNVLGLTNVNEIQNAQHMDLSADHNFTGQGRQQLIRSLQTILNN